MADKKNTEVPPASEPAAPVQQTAPVVVTEKRRWAMPLISALVVVAALVVGGIGGYALASATQAGGRPAMEQGQFPGGSGQGGSEQGGLQDGGQQNGERPQPPSDQSDGSTDDNSTDESDGDSTEG